MSEPLGDCAGCTFSNLGGPGPAAALNLADTSAGFVGCTFRDNLAAAAAPGVVLGRRNATVVLRGCKFSGNRGAGTLLHAEEERGAGGAVEGAAFFSDDVSLPVCQLPGGFSTVADLEEAGTGMRDMEGALLRMEMVCPLNIDPLTGTVQGTRLRRHNAAPAFGTPFALPMWLRGIPQPGGKKSKRARWAELRCQGRLSTCSRCLRHARCEHCAPLQRDLCADMLHA